MANPKVKFKRSSVPGKKPTVDQLPLGELCINTNDGIVYTSKSTDGGITTSIVNISGVNLQNQGSSVGFANTLNFVGTGISVLAVTDGVGIITVTASQTQTEQTPAKTTTSFVSTEGQTTFAVNYVVGSIDVFLNGIKLLESEYTATNGTSVVLNEPASLNDTVDVVSYLAGLARTFSNINVTGIATIGNTVIGGGTTQLLVNGDARITGILSIGTSSITFDGRNNTINVGTSMTISSEGIQMPGVSFGQDLSARSIQVSGLSTFTNGAVLIGSSSSTGTASQNLQVTGGSYVSGNLGIGSTNPTSKLTVVGNATISGVVTATTFIGNLSGISSSAITADSATYATSSDTAYYSTSSGYASTAGIATALQNARTFQITGDIIASPVTFDGTGNVSLAATIQPNSVALGSDTTGDYVQSISGTTNQITVTSGTGESSTPTLSIPTQFTAPQDVTVTRDLQVNRNLNVDGNITIGGTSATLFTNEFKVYDSDIILGFRTDVNNNDVSTDNTANHGGIAIASTEGNPLVQLFIAGIETNPSTYKKFMWFKSGTFSGLGTDAWISNYAVGIGSTQFPTGTRLSVGSVQFTERDIPVVRNINASGIITASSFTGNSATATYAVNAGVATYATRAGVATYATVAGIASYSSISGVSTLSQNLTNKPSIEVSRIVAGTATTDPELVGVTTSVEILTPDGFGQLSVVDPVNPAITVGQDYYAASSNITGLKHVNSKGELFTSSNELRLNVNYNTFNGIGTFYFGANNQTTFASISEKGIGIGTTGQTNKLTVIGDSLVSGVSTVGTTGSYPVTIGKPGSEIKISNTLEITNSSISVGLGTTTPTGVGTGSLMNATGFYIGTSYFNSSQLSSPNLNISGVSTFSNTINATSINSTGIITATKVSAGILSGTSAYIQTLEGIDLNYTGLSTIRTLSVDTLNADSVVIGISSFTQTAVFDNFYSVSGIVTSLSGSNINYSGIGTINTFNSSTANIGTLIGTSIIADSVTTDSIKVTGINTVNSGVTTVTILPSYVGVSTSYQLRLPPNLGPEGSVLILGQNGELGFGTAGLYENRIYVSSVNGDDTADGKSTPVKTIKRAAQLASFESFVLPGGRFIDAGNIIAANRQFIQEEVVGFVTATYPGITTAIGYDREICKRDVGYIVDAISYDLSYGGNSKSVEAGLAYWNAGTSYVEGESVETIAAYRHIVGISSYIINNIAVPNVYQNTVTQTFDFSLAYDESCNPSAYSENCCADVWSAIGSYVGIVTTIIGIGTTAAPAVTLPTTKSNPIAVFVEAGEYEEENPIILYEDVAIIGDNLRNTIIRPLNAGKDLFRVRNGCYLTGFAMKDYVDAAGVPQFTFDYAVAFDDPLDPFVSRTGYAVKTSKPIITRSPYIQNCSILSFLGGNGILVDGSKVTTPNTAIIPEESENPVIGEQPEFGKSMVANAFTMVSFGGLGWRVINDGYSQVVSCFQIFCRYGSLAQSGGYLSITNSATNFGLYALRSTGFNQRSYVFDRGIIAATGTSGGRQTLKAIGYGRTDQELYVLRFFNGAGVDSTSNFKSALVTKEFNATAGVNTTTDTVGILTHGFINGDKVLYIGDEGVIPPRVIGGLVSDNEYYVKYVNDNEFQLAEDESLTRIVNLTSTATGINTFIKGNQEFFAYEKLDSHNSYQVVGLASTSSSLSFVPGRQITQQVNGGTAVGYAYTYNSITRELIVSVESSGGVRNNFGVTGVGINANILDHSGSPVSIGITGVAGISSYYTVEYAVDSTETGNSIVNISNLPENYKLHFHRPSIVNSSSHTWEFSGSGTDYNALPQNGGKSDPATEQIFSQGGRVFTSGTNELGDFKIGSFITAYNRTGNIVFNNKVSIGQLDSIRLSLSGGVAVEEFSTDAGLGDNEIGGSSDSRVSTQKAVRSFLSNRLGDFIDKNVSANAVPSSIVQLNAFGQINADLIPPKVVNYYTATTDGGRTSLVDRIPAVDIKNGDTVLEPSQGWILISDVYGQYLILSDDTRDYNFQNGDEVISTVSSGGAVGIVTAPTSVGYGTTGLVKGVCLSVGLSTGGSGYTNPGIYTSVTLNSTTGAGTSARASITVGAGGSVTACTITYGGKGYVVGDTLTVNDPNNIGGRTGGSNFSVSVSNVETRLYLSLTNNQKFSGSSLLSDYISDRDAVGISTNLTSSYTVNFTPTDLNVAGDIDFTNDRIVVGINSFSDGDPVTYSTGGGNTLEELINGTTYYVKRVGISSIELYTTYALSSKKNFLTSGTGTHSLTRKTVNIDTEQIVFLNHGLSVGDAVKISGSTPAGITTGAFYFVGSATTNSFSLHNTQSIALSSINGLIFNPVGLASTNSGTFTLTKQNVIYSSTVNTSSASTDTWSVLATATIDAANIASGTISPSRLGGGTATSDTFLAGDSSYKRVVKSVGIASTEPITIISSSSETDAPSGITTHYGDLNVRLNRVQSTLDNFSTLGISKFKTSTFSIGADGAVSIKNSSTGDIDAATFGGNAPSYYLDINNLTGSIPITRGGTGLSALPSEGYTLIGNGSAYTLTNSPTYSGTVTADIDIPANSNITFTNGGTFGTEAAAKIQFFNNSLYLQYTTSLIARNSLGTNRMTLDSSGNVTFGGSVTGSTLVSNVASGTAPLTVTSTTVVSNLNADLLDGIQGSSFLRSDVSATNSTDLRAPIFYDSNDTGYYLNPNSTSDDALRIRGGALHGPNVTWGSYLLVGGDGRQNRINDANVASVCSTNGNLHMDAASGFSMYLNYYDGNAIYFGGGANNTWGEFSGGILYSYSQVRGTIFYDYNNTGYYVDPNSTSQLSYVLADNWFRPQGNTGLYFESYGRGLWSSDSAGNSYGNVSTYGGGRNGWYGWGIASRHCFMSTTGDNVGVHDNSRGWIWYWDGTYTRFDYGYTQFGGSARAPIFYDSNDTGYYCDPNGTTRLNGCEVLGRSIWWNDGVYIQSTNADGAGLGNMTFLIQSTYRIYTGVAGTGWRPQTAALVNLGNLTLYYNNIAGLRFQQASDRRRKNSIQDSDLGLNFITKLRPVSYKLNVGYTIAVNSGIEGDHLPVETSLPGRRPHYGFIAQEVKEVMDELGVDFGGWTIDLEDNPEQIQGLSYNEFISPMVKAIQELNAKVESLTEQLNALK